MKINEYKIKRENSIKFLGVLLDENLSWKDHIKYTENKIAKNIGILFKAKPYLTTKCMLSLYYSYIHSFVTYGNIAWASTHTTYLQKIAGKQKHAIRIIFNKKRFESTREIFRSNKILNVYQINIMKNLVFMHQVSTKTTPKIFLPKFQKPYHSYPTRFSKHDYSRPTSNLEKCKYRISSRGPFLWNKFLVCSEKETKSLHVFKENVKNRLLQSENETDFF